ncbi:MAG: endonuclease Q family protein [Candidatus Bipolaricaulaceae bacterium]
MRVIADLHLHSRYSRATSADMDLPGLARWAKLKGINLLGTGDFTHPAWFRELVTSLRPAGEGVYEYEGTHFLFTAEVAAVWNHSGRLRRVHFLLFAPGAEDAARISKELGAFGNLSADGRPTLGISGEKLVEVVKGASPKAVIIPAHAWTPWWSVFGSNSGFDSLEEALGRGRSEVFAIETGLSSDPPMNWRLSALDEVALVSFSDAHSPTRLGREACVFELPELSYPAVLAALRQRDRKRFLFTVEFFPEEGKYHYDGHRACGVVFSPAETRRHGGKCPVCGKPLTVGVMHRVEELADRPPGEKPGSAIPYRSLVPLQEIIAQVLGQAPETRGVLAQYLKVIQRFGAEFPVLLDVPAPDVEREFPKLGRALEKVRRGELSIRPGYDGVYGEIKINLEEPRELSLF